MRAIKTYATGSKSRVTAAGVLRANGGVGPGFDALRLGAFSLGFRPARDVYWVRRRPGHSVRRQSASQDPTHAVLPMFFLVSGYLVTGSAIRTRAFSTFLLFRVFRIVPALAVEVIYSTIDLVIIPSISFGS